MYNANDLRVDRARRAEQERAARRQQAARQSKARTSRRNAWARVAALFV